MKTSKAPKEIIVAKRDDFGNTLIKYSDGSIALKLVTENGRERNLGLIIDDSFHTYRKFSHIHHKSKSYGFNWAILNKSKFEWVVLELEDGNSYKIPKQTILKIGKVLRFKNTEEGDSFELQIFLPIAIIETYKIV
jgi:hypothetical protein